MPRPVRRRLSRGQKIACTLVALVLLRLLVDFLSRHPAVGTVDQFHEGPCEVVRIVDGDTIIVEQVVRADESSPPRPAKTRLRLIGIDTPESVKPNHAVEPWGPEAARFTGEFLRSGNARLRLDRQRKDQYDRLLAYVYVEEQMLNEELVRAGLARITPYPGNSQSIARRLAQAEQEARQAQRGIWSQP